VVSGAYTLEIETETLGNMRAYVEPYGLEIVRFGNFNIAMGEEDEERLNKFYERASYVNMTGGLQGYQQLAQAEMMMGAAEGMKKGGNGGGAFQGAGIGMGFAMAGQMTNMMGQLAQQAPAQARPIAPTQLAPGGQVKCGGCGAMVNPGKFCPECGKTLQAAGPKFCGNCGKPMSGKFCAECGTAAG